MSLEAGNKSISSHRLDNITPDSLTPQSGSPDAEKGYSPHSQPFAERPKSLTSAGAAVRESASSSLPSPPPFTPSPEAQSERVSPVAFVNFSAESCGSQGPATDTPGVTSAWAASSTKPARQQTESFAFHPHGASAASSPDVDQFQATSNATSPALATLLNRAAQSITTSADVDAASECSETASRSSVTSRGSSRRVDGQSPGDLLRKAKVIFEKRAAIEGSSRLRHNRKVALKTPLDKGIPASVTPHNTPMDVQLDQHGDQATVLESPAVCAGHVTTAGTPGSVTGPVTASLDSPDDRKKLSSTKVLSPPDSGVSVVSIGSVCPTADVGRKLDFSTAPEVPAVPIVADFRLPGGTSSPMACSPMALDKLMDSVQDTATKRDIKAVLDGADVQEALPFIAVDTAEQPDPATAFQGPVQPQITGNSWLTWSAKALLLTMVFVGVCGAGFLAVELLPAGTSGPGILCTPYDAQACLAAHKAYWASEAPYRDLPRWRVLVKRLKWHMQDAWDSFALRKMPAGVTEADLAYPLISRITEKQQQEMPIELVQQLFGDMSADVLPPIIATRLETAEVTAAAQQPPQNLVADSEPQFNMPEQPEEQPSPNVESAVEQQHITDAAPQLSLSTGAEGAALATADAAAQHPGAAIDDDEMTAFALEQAAAEAGVESAAAHRTGETQLDTTADNDESPLHMAAVGQYDSPEAKLGPEEQKLSLSADSTEQQAYIHLEASLPVVPEVNEVTVATTEESLMPAEASTTQSEGLADVASPAAQLDGAPQPSIEAVQLDADMAQSDTAAAHLDSAATQPAAQPEGASVPGAELELLFEAQPDLQEHLKAASQSTKLAQEEHDYSDSSTQPASPESEAVVKPAVERPAGLQYMAYLVRWSTRACLFHTGVPPAGVVAAALLSMAAFFAFGVGKKSPSATGVNMTEPDEGIVEEDDVAGLQETLQEDVAQVMEAEAQVDDVTAEVEHAGLLSDEEPEPQVHSTPRHTSAAALLDAAITAGASTVEKVHKVLRFKASPSPIHYYPSGPAADTEAAAQPAAHRTPRAAAARAAASGRTPRATSSRRTRSTAVASEDDGEEVQQAAPASTGQARRATRGRKSAVLPEVPENMPAADGALLSDEEVQVKASTRVRRQKVPADPELEVAATRGRRRLSAPTAVVTVEATTPGRVARRSGRMSQG